MPALRKNDPLEMLAEQNEHRSWADFGTTKPQHPLLKRYISGYTYSIGCLKEQNAKLITRAYPTVMTQIYFEFHGGLSEIRGQDHGFGKRIKKASWNGPTASQENQNVVIEKRTYIKQGLGDWFDIYQIASEKPSRPIKNLKVDLFPMAIYELFNYSAKELDGEDLQLADLLGQATTSLMLEEMEAANSGKRLIQIVESYFLAHLRNQIKHRQLEVVDFQLADKRNLYWTKTKGFTPPLPKMHESLTQQAKSFNKSGRWLQKRYSEVYGMSFKQIQSNLRFHRAHRELWQTMSTRQPISLTELAYRSGYFDQAHFIKDFKLYTGMTPGQYLKTNFDLQSQYLWYW